MFISACMIVQSQISNITPENAKIMTCNRFRRILQNIHLADSEKIERDEKSKKCKDRIAKCREFANMTTDSYLKGHFSSQFLVVDEAMAKFTGRSQLTTANPMKY